jgi:hypothetical protein
VPPAIAAIIKIAMIDADIIFIKASLYRVSSLPAGDYHAQTMSRSYCRTLEVSGFSEWHLGHFMT